MRCLAVTALLVGSLGCGHKPAGRLEMVEAPSTTAVAPLIAAERERATHDGKQLLVYAGAEWCPPCQHFHEAARSGKLDAAFSNLRLIVFDSDRDMPALNDAGYKYTAIPMFAVPRTDGTASGQQIEDAPNTEAAVDDITPRLRKLLDSR